MITLVVVWGNPREPGERVAFSASLPTGKSLRLSPDTQYAYLEVGPSTVDGPVISRVPGMGDGDDGTLVVLADQEIPDWVENAVPTEWGWHRVDDFPRPERLPFQADVLLLSLTSHHELQGMSTTMWLDAGVRPLQRTHLRVHPDSELLLDVRVLECGSSDRGAGFMVAFCPDRDKVRLANLPGHGWWKEQWVQIRGEDWKSLIQLSAAVETNVVALFRTPIVAQVTIHDLLAIPDKSLSLLPRDVRESLETALLAYGGDAEKPATASEAVGEAT